MALRLPFDATHECRPPRALPAECEPLVRPVHPARAKERRYQAGFLTSRIVALVAAFSKSRSSQWHDGDALTGYSCGSSAGFGGQFHRTGLPD